MNRTVNRHRYDLYVYKINIYKENEITTVNELGK